MKKKMMALAASAALAVLTLGSCATINSGAALAEKAPIGPKVGEAQSTYFLGLWSSQGEQNNIKKAAENGGISKVSQVEYIDQSIFLGLLIKHTTRVYGE
jgi:ABC-type sugar transport system substrate-binding protein